MAILAQESEMEKIYQSKRKIELPTHSIVRTRVMLGTFKLTCTFLFFNKHLPENNDYETSNLLLD